MEDGIMRMIKGLEDENHGVHRSSSVDLWAIANRLRPSEWNGQQGGDLGSGYL